MTLDLDVKLGGEKPEILKTLLEPVIDPEKYPVFARAYECRVPAHNTQIEWTTPKGIAKNYQQIFRQPFVYRIDGSDLGEKAEKALEKLLESMEQTLVLGVPSRKIVESDYGSWPLATMGGVRHYLGRDLQADDVIELRPLYPPTLLLQRGEFDLFNDYTHEGEWICETSLVVRPAKEN